MLCKVFAQCYAENVVSCLKKKRGCLDFKGKCSVLKCEENRKVYRLTTEGCKIAKYHVDSGLINDATQKCDYMLICYGNECKIVFVELKGNDTNHACDQLKATLDLLADRFTKIGNKRFFVRIVNTKSVPNIKTTAHYKNLRAKLNLLNPSNGEYIKISSRKLDESLSNLESSK